MPITAFSLLYQRVLRCYEALGIEGRKTWYVIPDEIQHDLIASWRTTISTRPPGLALEEENVA